VLHLASANDGSIARPCTQPVAHTAKFYTAVLPVHAQDFPQINPSPFPHSSPYPTQTRLSNICQNLLLQRLSSPMIHPRANGLAHLPHYSASYNGPCNSTHIKCVVLFTVSNLYRLGGGGSSRYPYPRFSGSFRGPGHPRWGFKQMDGRQYFQSKRG
jgi:hypothetical protein